MKGSVIRLIRGDARSLDYAKACAPHSLLFLLIHGSPDNIRLDSSSVLSPSPPKQLFGRGMQGRQSILNRIA